MARRNSTDRSRSYRHPEADALLRPDVGTQPQFRKKKAAATFRYDSSLSPALDWAGKAERLSFDVPTLPLFVHERLSTAAILETLKGHRREDRPTQFDLFGERDLPIHDRLLKAYEHRDGWVNRLILGDSLVVMNSLLGYEGLGGQVQTIYVDPPYAVESLLSQLCDKLFLRLWSWPTPRKEDGKELCDLIAIFDDHVFLFFDRESKALRNTSKDIAITWPRWKKEVIDKQIKTAKGAARYIGDRRPIYLDTRCEQQFPGLLPDAPAIRESPKRLR